MAIELRAHPLIVAAALGLLGPAALADDDDDVGIAGVWMRAAAPEVSDLRRHVLGERIEVIPVEDRVLLDDGIGPSSTDGVWVRRDDGSAVQTLVVDGQRIEREFQVDGDALMVLTRIEDAQETTSWHDTFRRSG